MKTKSQTKPTKEKAKQYAATYYRKNKKKHQAAVRKWGQNNKEAYKAINKRYLARRLKRDPLYAMKEKIRGNVRSSFERIMENKPTNTEKLLGCSWLEAKKHFERLFLPGMTWDNHGNVSGTWNIDHIRPVSDFREDELHLMNLIENLQPLWYDEHQRKSIEERKSSKKGRVVI